MVIHNFLTNACNCKVKHNGPTLNRNGDYSSRWVSVPIISSASVGSIMVTCDVQWKSYNASIRNSTPWDVWCWISTCRAVKAYDITLFKSLIPRDVSYTWWIYKIKWRNLWAKKESLMLKTLITKWNQLDQARNMTSALSSNLQNIRIGVRKNICFCNLRMWKGLNKNRLTSLLFCFSSFLRFMAIFGILLEPVCSLYINLSFSWKH